MSSNKCLGVDSQTAALALSPNTCSAFCHTKSIACNELKYTAPLTGITAAMFGVILNLALLFGYHVRWPNGFEGAFDWPSALIAVGSAVALFRFKRGVTQVLCVSALAGLISQTIQ